MIAVDTNILVYAHMNQSDSHERAIACMDELWSGEARWMIPWPCLHEFYAVVTNRHAYKPPSTPGRAVEQIEEWLASESLVVASEGGQHWPMLRRLAKAANLTGSKIYDAKIAAICLQAGVTTLWTADRDFSLFPDLHCVNPFVRRK